MAGDTNGAVDLFIKDLTSGITTRVSTDLRQSGLAPAPPPSIEFSPDGTEIVFVSSDPNLVPGDTNNASDVS